MPLSTACFWHAAMAKALARGALSRRTLDVPSASSAAIQRPSARAAGDVPSADSAAIQQAHARVAGDVPSADSAAIQRANARVAAKSRSRKRKAAAPSTAAPPTKKRVRSSCAPRPDCIETSAVAQRLVTGRSCENYMLLLHTSLLSPVDKGPTQSLPAVRGLTAMYQGQPVFVLDSFMSRGWPEERCG